jgi:hypothetical protein
MYWHAADFRLLALLGATLVCVGLFLSQQGGEAANTSGGWRQIDLPTLQQRIDAGELSDREALWYHPATPEELSQPKGAMP